MNRQCETLKEYIDRHFSGNQSKFAQHMHVTPQQVTRWIAGNWIVVGGILYSPKRRIYTSKEIG
ncbi:helix-turn-helix domain-containing protein [Photorhabdus sp. APURE]|uniref:hypothetical protein n=1 Tax=Photorhabdus aballayi TaxID=2991723 RepID=UPI00223E2C37|nr:hypothetical protein [Photorhabdus aballayi]MCW7549989.1 helix-turn-helix domain-containing protein [Photorhabdus aballayi]